MNRRRRQRQRRGELGDSPARGEARRAPVGGGDQGDGAGQDRAAEQAGAEQEGTAPLALLMPHAERLAAPDEQRGQGPARERLLDVQSLEEVEGSGDHEYRHGQRPGAPSAPHQVEAEDHQRDPRRERQRVGRDRDLPRHQFEQQVDAGVFVRGERRADVDDTHRDGAGAGEGGEAVRACAVPERGGHAVHPGAPRGGVAQLRKQVTPVLPDEPGPERHDDQRQRRRQWHF